MVLNHNVFERISNNLFTVFNLGLYESYAVSSGDLSLTMRFLDGSLVTVKPPADPLHIKDGSRKVRGYGMPYLDKNTGTMMRGDLYVRFNLVLPAAAPGAKFPAEFIEALSMMFPVIKDNEGVYSKEPVDGANEITLESVTSEDLEQLEYDDDGSETESENSGEYSM